MTTPKPSILATAKTLWSPGLVLQQIGLGLLVFLLALGWLRLPDASVLDVVATVLLALLIVAIAGAGESAMILRLCNRPRTPRRLLFGTLLLLAGWMVWLGWSSWIDHLAIKNDPLAGYLNSRFPRHMRYFFTYSHIMLWLGWIETAAAWIGSGLIVPAIVALTAGGRPVRAMLAVLRSVSYWIIAIVGVIVASVFTTSLMHWLPGSTLRMQMLSLLLRLVVVVLVDATIASFLFVIAAAGVRQSDAFYSTPAGTPEDSHERTAEIP